MAYAPLDQRSQDEAAAGMGDDVEGGRLLRQCFEQHPGVLLGRPRHGEMIERKDAIPVTVLDVFEEV